ncbi:hypothetical protein PGH44_09675 [Legionella pneumophila]|nr:hypothetical protein PGH44_09675 [Legionella pneumophila]
MKTLSEINPNPQDSEKPNNLTLEAIEELESVGERNIHLLNQ